MTDRGSNFSQEAIRSPLADSVEAIVGTLPRESRGSFGAKHAVNLSEASITVIHASIGVARCLLRPLRERQKSRSHV